MTSEPSVTPQNPLQRCPPRGVRFGLVPGGRVEAVMVSCPPLVAWDYGYVPPPGSEEERLMSILKRPKEWV